jgi:hypothetical protein
MQTNLNDTECGSTASKRGQTINKGTGIIVRNEQTDDKSRCAIPKQETILVNEIAMAKIVVECLKQTDSQEAIRSMNIRDKFVHLKPVKCTCGQPNRIWHSKSKNTERKICGNRGKGWRFFMP